MTIYIVVWAGGYEPPSYTAYKTKKEAMETALEWWEDADEDDWIDILKLENMRLERVETLTREEAK